MYSSDCYLKVYNTGNLAGKFAIFFESNNAKKVAVNCNAPLIDGIYILAFSQNNLDKGRKFLENNKLHYTEYILG